MQFWALNCFSKSLQESLSLQSFCRKNLRLQAFQKAKTVPSLLPDQFGHSILANAASVAWLTLLGTPRLVRAAYKAPPNSPTSWISINSLCKTTELFLKWWDGSHECDLPRQSSLRCGFDDWKTAVRLWHVEKVQNSVNPSMYVKNMNLVS